MIIIDAVDVNARGLDDAFEERRLLVLHDRRHSERAVNSLMVYAGDELGQTAFTLLQRHAGVLIGVVVAAFGRAGLVVPGTPWTSFAKVPSSRSMCAP